MIREEKITLDGCFESLMKFPNNKSPGSDGLSVEFYKFFWNNIKSFLIDSYDYSFENDLLSLDQHRALLVLIPKGTKDKRLLKNWRPISLLNVDYKILAKVLAIRLQKVISHLISSDQTGYIKGRYIGDNVRTMLDILEITKQQADPGIMVMIDFKKVFDTLSWSFLYKTLDYFNFGPVFKQYIKLLYSSPECSVTNNGFHSEFFSISRGIRQGCPISTLLFILCVETLRGRHKLYKSCGDRQIFRRCLLFAIGRSSPDFLDLEPCHKGQAADVCRPPPGDCSVTARFAPQMTKFSADVPTTIGRRPSGDFRGTCRSPSDDNKSYDHRQVIGHCAVIYGFAMGEILNWTFNFRMFI